MCANSEEGYDFTVRLPPDLKDRLVNTSRRLNISEADVARLALAFFCDNEGLLRVVESARLAQKKEDGKKFRVFCLLRP
jgi:predicted transcriptional regulator